MRYDDAVAALFQAPLDQFVTERKRLAGELKAAGEPAGAAKLAKLARPPISAWAVDQLWWHARAAFDALFETAQRLRDGKLAAMAAHREALAKLRAQAAKLLSDAGHGATEATLRRVTQTLSALAAAGGWDPDLPGALSADRDPPGFEAIGVGNAIALPAMPAARLAPDQRTAANHAADIGREHRGEAARATDGAARNAAAAHNAEVEREAEAERDRQDAAEAQRRREREAAAARAEAAAALRRAEAERARAAAERHRLEAALRTAHGEVAQREREVARLERDLALARGMVAQAKAVVEGLEARLAQLEP